jgi:hypothetical protein
VGITDNVSFCIKVIFREEDGREVKSAPYKVSHIDCEKDTAEILNLTIAPTLNESLKRITVGAACQLTVFCSGDNESTANQQRYALFGDEDAAGNNQPGVERTFLWTATVRVFLTGDLAFYSTILGKENMSGAWCAYCWLAHADWQALEHTDGQAWTIESLGIHLEKLNDGTLNKKIPQEVRGVTAKVMFDAVPLKNWIVPVLHICIGIGNGILKRFLDFVDKRIENLPEPLIELRLLITKRVKLSWRITLRRRVHMKNG